MSLRGVLMVDSVRGTMRARAWPRKRGKPKAAVTLAWNQWFRDAAKVAKFIDAKQTITAMDETRNTGLYPRDVIFRAMSVGIADLVLPNGQIYQHGPQVRFKIMFQGVIFRSAATLSLVSNVVTIIQWPLPTIDTHGFWSSAAPTRITIPDGVEIVQITTGFASTAAVSGRLTTQILLNGAILKALVNTNSAGTTGQICNSGPLVVQPGDWLEIRFFSASGMTLRTDGSVYAALNVLQTT